MNFISEDNIDWDEHWQSHKDDQDFRDPKAFDYFQDLLPKNFTVIELGCGMGKWYPIFENLGCSFYLGIDASEKAIEIASSKEYKNAMFLRSRAELPHVQKYHVFKSLRPGLYSYISPAHKERY